MKNKRGFLRILEAFIAIALIAGVMSFLYVSQIQKSSQESTINDLIRIILEKISNEQILRKAVLNANSNPNDPNVEKIKTEIEKFIPPSGELVFHFSICKINEICSCGANIGGGYIPTSGGPNCPTDKDIYSDEVSVSVTLDSGSVDPKVLRLFVWEK
ncbi:hypothetical protein COU53_00085 [Candidatus Pacearchaeota archaeon CG10_big_fil_rev_8_21_14_0_10_30_48]|nr:MAG: hypothetical protein COU53_00085 [Candidatus Pacearchaeota archaeon CG10_big_fil_rev_8_21_14_0_10_30_48]